MRNRTVMTQFPLRHMLVIAALMLLWVRPATAQIESTTLPDTTPPGLLLVVIVDDSSTMNEPNLNSIETALGGDVTRRNATDDGMARWRAVGRLMTILHADMQSTHQVALMSFDNDVRGWYSGSDDDPFVTLGNGGNDNAYRGVMNNINQADAGARPGDTVDAIREANRAIQAWSERNGALTRIKPVILLLTDDVPIRTWGESPWRVPTNWLTEIDATYKREVAAFTDLINYTGDFCRHNDGDGMMYTVAMGAANWIDFNGALNQNANGSYFSQIAANNGFYFLDPVTSRAGANTIDDVAVLRLDPNLTGTSLPAAELENAINRIIDDMRCLYSEDVQSNSISGATVTFDAVTITPFTSHFQLIFAEPNTTNITVIAPDGTVINNTAVSAAVDDSTAGVKIVAPTGGRSNYQVWAFNRDVWLGGSDAWEGEWQVEIRGGTTSILRLLYSLDVTDLHWNVVGNLDDDSQRIAIEIIQAGRPIQLTGLVESVRATVRNLQPGAENPTNEVIFRQRDGTTYEASLPSDTGIYRINPFIVIDRIVKGTTLASSSRIALPEIANNRAERVEITRSTIRPQLRVAEPQANTDINDECRDDGTLDFEVEIGFGPLDDAGEQLVERIYSYVRVEVYHRFADETFDAPQATATPLAVLAGNLREGAFTAAIPCALLDARARDAATDVLSEAQVFEYRPISNVALDLPDSVSADFTYITPTPTATATPLPLPTATQPIPTPPRVEPADEVGNVLTSPPGSIIFGAVGVLIVGTIILSAINGYVRNGLLLRQVAIERYTQVNDTWQGMGLRPVITGASRLIPRRSVTITTDDARRKPLFSLEAAPDLLSGVAYVPLQIGALRVLPGDTFELYGEANFILAYDGEVAYRFRIFDNDARRVNFDDYSR